MEVDPPPATCTVTTAVCTLKRSNSAPMINVLTVVTSTSPTASTSSTRPISINTGLHSPGGNSFRPISGGDAPRVRRYSMSGPMLLHSPTGGIKSASRICQLKQEESLNVANREAAHEREVQSAMQISQSWDELSLDDPMMTECKRQRSLSETQPLHIFTSPMQPLTSSPSPTRVGKQCFSPSLQSALRNNSLTPSSSPSPTRKSLVRRSLSPIALRPSTLGMKRKIDSDIESYVSPPKRFHNGPATPERLLGMPHPLAHNAIMSHGLDNSSSPEQTVPNVITSSSASSSVSTSSSSSMDTNHLTVSPAESSYFTFNQPSPSRSPPCFGFRPVVRPTLGTQQNICETSEMVEGNNNMCERGADVGTAGRAVTSQSFSSAGTPQL